MRQVLIKICRILFLSMLAKIVKQPEYNGL